MKNKTLGVIGIIILLAALIIPWQATSGPPPTSGGGSARGVTGPATPVANNVVKFTGTGEVTDNTGLIFGTMTDGKMCTYTSSGTLLACNTTIPTGAVPNTTYMTDANQTITSTSMGLGTEYSNVDWSAGHTIFLPNCDATTSTTSFTPETTFRIKTANAMHIVSPDSKIISGDVVGCTAGQALNTTTVAGDFIKLRCERTGASTYGWVVMGMLGLPSCVTR